MNELADVFAELDDPRAVNARRHSLHNTLVIALCTVISGGQTCTDMELYGHAKRDLPQSFLKLENGIPSHDTLPRHLWDGILRCAQNYSSHDSNLEEPLPHRSIP